MMSDPSDTGSIVVRAIAFQRHFTGKELRVEAVVLNNEYGDVPVHDVQYLLSGNHAGAATTIRPERGEEKHEVSLTIPIAALNVAAGQKTLNVQLRAMTTNGQCVGNTRPMPVNLGD
jgi:hypothetical protein